MSLTRDEILSLNDLTVKELPIPETIPVWGGKTVFIKQLNRGLQNAYNKRLRGQATFKQDKKEKKNEVIGMTIDGHDSWLFSKGVCDENGNLIFTDRDIKALDEKSGEAIGWVAAQIVEFSGMAEDAKVASGEIAEEEAVAEELKT